MKVIISNGFHKFHLAFAAECAFECDALEMLITGAYPSGQLKAVLAHSPAGRSSAVQRLLAREIRVNSGLIRPLFLAEMIELVGRAVGGLNWGRIAERRLALAAMNCYSRLATKYITESADRADIYHYRSGFGGASLSVARQSGMFLLCDHSIVHPSVLNSMVHNLGKLPLYASDCNVDPFWRAVLKDLAAADKVVVNSQFVKRTFLGQGWAPENIEVVYLGIDDEFLQLLPDDIIDSKLRFYHEPPTLCFAGALNARKGADHLIEALRETFDLPWRLTIAGSIDPEIQERHHDFLSCSRVHAMGWVSRGQLARIMAGSDIFILPSLAEGSARVVFEALSAGCFVITTPNAGSIVEDGEGGQIVSPGNVDELRSAIREVLKQDRSKVARVGRRNRLDVLNGYRQSSYGARLMEVYLSMYLRKGDMRAGVC